MRPRKIAGETIAAPKADGNESPRAPLILPSWTACNRQTSLLSYGKSGQRSPYQQVVCFMPVPGCYYYRGSTTGGFSHK